MRYMLLSIAMLGMGACSPAAQPDAEPTRPGDVIEVAPGASSSDDMVVPDETMPAPAPEDKGDHAIDGNPGEDNPDADTR